MSAPAFALAEPSWLQVVRDDLAANGRNHKGVVLVLMYRVAHACLELPGYLAPLRWLVVFLYKLVTEYALGTEIHWRSTFGPGLVVYHGYGIVVNSATVAGRGCVLRQGVTIGVKSTNSDLRAPVLGDHVDIGAAAILLGPIHVGDHCVIGAGAVVVKSLPAGAVAVGNPARIVGRK